MKCSQFSIGTVFSYFFCVSLLGQPPISTLFPYTTLFRSVNFCVMEAIKLCRLDTPIIFIEARINLIGVSDRKSGSAGMPRPISYAVFCLKKKKEKFEELFLLGHIEQVILLYQGVDHVVVR